MDDDKLKMAYEPEKSSTNTINKINEADLLPMEVGVMKGFTFHESPDTRGPQDFEADWDNNCQPGEPYWDQRRERDRSGTKSKRKSRNIKKRIAAASRKRNRVK